MADTMITFSGDLNKAKFGKIDTPLQAAILHESDLLTTKGGVKDWLFNIRKSTKWAELVQYQDELGLFKSTAEGAAGEQDRFVETFNKTIQHTTFKKDVIITMEALQDANYGITADMKDKSSSLVRAYYRTQHELAQKMIYAGNGTTFELNGQTYAPTTCDKKALFSNAHEYGKNNKTQSNYFHTSDALSAEVVDDIIVELASKLRMMKDETGNAMGYVLDTIIIPGNTPKLEKFVKQYLGSPCEAKSSNNGINIGYGNYNLVILPSWEITDGSDCIIGMSSEANKNLLGSVFYDRMPLDIKMHEDESTRNLLINGTCRFGVGHNTYKHIVRCDIGGTKNDGADTL